MNVISLDVNADGAASGSKWRFYVIGDPHVDNVATDLPRLERYIKLISEDPHGVYVIIGDVVDGTTASHFFWDPRAVRDDVVLNQDEYIARMMLELEELFAPLKGKPGVVMCGNHDIRKGGTKWSGISWYLAQKLGAQYGDYECLVRITARGRGAKTDTAKGRGIVWTAYCFHGAGGGMLPGGKVNRFQRDALITADADIYCRGHVGDNFIRILPRYGVTRKGNPPRLIERPVAQLTQGGFQKSRVENRITYVNRKGYTPTDETIYYLEITNPVPGRDRSNGHGGRIRPISPPF